MFTTEIALNRQRDKVYSINTPRQVAQNEGSRRPNASRTHSLPPPRPPPPAPRRRINANPLECAPWPHTRAGESVPAKGRRKLTIGRAMEAPALATAGGGGGCGAKVGTTVSEPRCNALTTCATLLRCKAHHRARSRDQHFPNMLRLAVTRIALISFVLGRWLVDWFIVCVSRGRRPI